MDKIKRGLLIIWIAAISVNATNDISPLPSFFALEGRNANFRWTYPSSFTIVEWRDGDIDGTIMMKYTYSTSTLLKNKNYNIDYINETDSIGMVLKNISLNDTGLYTVKLIIDNSNTVQADTDLTVVADDNLDECKSNKSIIASDTGISCGSSNIPSGSTIIKVSLPASCDLNPVIMVNYSLSPTSDQHIGCKNMSETPCSFYLYAVPDREITIVFWSDQWQGEQFECKFSVKGSSTPTSLPPKGTKPGLTDPQIAGIVIGVVICCGIIIVVIVLVLKKKNIKKDNRTGSRNMLMTYQLD